MLNERWALWRVVKWLRQIFSGAESVEAISFDTGFDNPTHSEGLFFYDNTEDALAYYNEEAELTVHVGQDSVVKVRNATGSLISKGEAVYSNGATGNRPNILLARANALSTSKVLGLAAHDIENNTDGYVIQVGHIADIDTSSFNAGDELFLSSATAGAITNTKPTGANFAVVVGECVVSNPSTGEIVVQLRPTADAAQKSVAQTVTGAWTFANDLTVSESGQQAEFRVYDSSGSDYISISHDGTDAQISCLNTGDIDVNESLAVRAGAAGLKLYGTTDDHLYISFYADAAAQTSRSAYMGFSSAGSEVFQFVLDQYSGGRYQFNKDVTIDSVAGGTALKLDSTTSWTSGTLNTPGIQWREDDGSIVAGIRGFVDSGDNNRLSIGLGNYGTEIRLHPNRVELGTPLAIPDGSTAPSAISGIAYIYVDSADGDLKVKFGDGHTVTLAADS